MGLDVVAAQLKSERHQNGRTSRVTALVTIGGLLTSHSYRTQSQSIHAKEKLSFPATGLLPTCTRKLHISIGRYQADLFSHCLLHTGLAKRRSANLTHEFEVQAAILLREYNQTPVGNRQITNKREPTHVIFSSRARQPRSQYLATTNGALRKYL